MATTLNGNSGGRRIIAFLGSTGSTGNETLKTLLLLHSSSSPDGGPTSAESTDSDSTPPFKELRLLVRSKAKLLNQFPGIESRHPNITIFEGQLTDNQTVAACLAGADVVICTLGENNNIPGVNVLQTGAHAIVDALRSNSSNAQQPTRILFLSSATWNPRLAQRTPAPFALLIKTAFYHAYADLRKAHAILQEAQQRDPGLLSLLLVQPPAIVEDVSYGGARISVDECSPAVAYEDLGRGFAELATDARYDELFGGSAGGGIGGIVVSSREGGKLMKGHALEILSRVVVGLVSGFVPGYWPVRNWVSRTFGV